MRCIVEPDLASFGERVLPYLHRDPVRNNVLCTTLGSRLHGLVPLEPDALWVRVLDEHDELVAVAFQTPPYPLQLTAAPPAAVDAVVDHLLARRPDLAMVNGSQAPVDRFAWRWGEATGREPSVSMRQRMFRLDRVAPPAGVAGRLRPASGTDRQVLIEWISDLRREATPDAPATDVPTMIDRALDGDGGRPGRLWLWEAAGEPVSMLATPPFAAGVARINAVYTPPARRGHGYASACVAAASQWALDHGAEACMLHTDLANPTSNRIYQAIGYYPVGDATQWRL